MIVIACVIRDFYSNKDVYYRISLSGDENPAKSPPSRESVFLEGDESQIYSCLYGK
ncbi:hypothetical protein WN55_00725 [Dufourea novaeangliae]|uniref:Uncharacterized protein n=1 Tax=Dufourea novaeangliae TaxID=178035 RepID=A0A154NYA2_DUFNO|nr:hypothetical protein WN55_00725 [Dufourea novaeangliae]